MSDPAAATHPSPGSRHSPVTRHPSPQPEPLEHRVDERVSVEFGEVFHLLADAHVLDRQPDLLADGHATPPLAVPSILASTMPVHCTASVKRFAWLMPFWPVVASSTSSTSCGAPGIFLPITR